MRFIDICIFLCNTIKGYAYYNYLKIKFKQYNFIVFPNDDHEISQITISLLDKYLYKTKNKKIVICSTSNSILKQIKSNKFICFKISKYWLENLASLYIMKDISNKFLFVSIKKPYDTGAMRLMGLHGTSKYEIVYYDILKMDT